MARLRWLRWADGTTAAVLLWALASAALGLEPASAALIALVGLAAAAAIRPLRVRWRPVSGWVGLRVSRGLRPGDRAWYVRAREASLVVVTARHGVRLVIAGPELAGAEGLSVRRTRVLVIPA